MPKSPNPKIINLTPAELEALRLRIDTDTLTSEDKTLLKEVLESHSWLYRLLESSKITVRRLRKFLFSGSEKNDRRSPKDNKDSTGGGSNKGEHDSDSDEPSPANDTVPDATADDDAPKGHGRNGVSAYTNREQVSLMHPTLKPGDSCPEELCGGKLYASRPGSFIRVMGQSMAKVVEYVVQKLRCSRCTTVFSAPTPCNDNNPLEKYDIPFRTLLVLNRFFLSVPYYRQADFHEMCGTPLPESTQWGLVQEVGGVIIPVFKQLEYLGAQAPLVYGDDTVFKILSLIAQNKQKDQARTGMFTTCLLAVAETKIVLFYTGRKHLGENLSDLIKLRKPHLAPMLQMCDALSSNVIEHPQITVCHCLAHARRKFHEIKDHFPEECQTILNLFGTVYHQDSIAKRRELSSQARLAHHQEHSQPVLKKLHTYMSELISQRKVEPNSELGKAIAYNLRHWERLTRFVQLPGVPLDNNFCEQSLKLPIRNRKNSMFYKNEYSAKISSMLMSVIYTCKLNNINPVDYLNTLQYHEADVRQNPTLWLPWNYHDMILKKAA